MDGQQIVKSVGWLGETWGFWIQTGAFFVSAAAALWVIWSNGRQARTRALIDILMHHKSDKDLIAATTKVYELHDSGTRLSALVSTNSEDRRTILKVLNTHEFLAVGIRMRAFNETVYKQMQCSNVLKLWNASEGFVIEMRHVDKIPTIFQDFERLASRWSIKPISKIKPWYKRYFCFWHWF